MAPPGEVLGLTPSFRVDEFDDSPQLRGWVSKAPTGGVKGAVGKWNPRWFELRGHMLFYYSSEPRDQIDLRSCAVQQDAKDRRCIVLSPDGGRERLKLCADRPDAHSADAWMAAIHRARSDECRRSQSLCRLGQRIECDDEARLRAVWERNEAMSRLEIVSQLLSDVQRPRRQERIPSPEPAPLQPLPSRELPPREDTLMLSCQDIGSPLGDDAHDEADCPLDLTRDPSTSSPIVPMFGPGEYQKYAIQHGVRTEVDEVPPAAPAQPAAAAVRDTSSLPPGFARRCPVECRGHSLEVWDFRRPDALRILDGGGGLFTFACKTGDHLSPADRRIATALINRSCFDDEMAQNGVEHMDLSAHDVLKAHTFMLTQATYVLPFVHPDDVTVERMSCADYHKQCQVPGTKVFEDTPPATFRITKVIVPWLLSSTIQFRVSEVPESDLPELAALMYGLTVHKALLLERTKRVMTAKDMTKKAKSILLYHFLQDGGAVVNNVTVIANTSIPKVVAKVLNSLGGRGSSEVGTTAQLARKYFRTLRGTAR